MKRFFAVAAALVLLMGCTDYDGKTDPVDVKGSVCLINGLGDVGTMSVINDLCVIENDVLSLGKWPNHIIEAGGILYVVNSGNNNVQIIDSSTLQSTGSVELTPFSNPMRAAVAGRKLYATNSFGTGVDVYDFDKDSLYTIQITMVPDSCKNGGTDAIISNGTKVFVGVRNVKYDESWNAIYGTEYIAVIDAANDSVFTAFEAGINVAAMLVNEENELHVLSTGNRDDIGGFVRVFDLAGINFAAYSTVSIGSQPGSFAINGEGMAYVAVSGMNPDFSGFGGIMKYNSITNEILNGQDNMLYSSASSGILGICIDGIGRVYAPVFNENKLVVLENDIVKTTLITGNGPQSPVFVKE